MAGEGGVDPSLDGIDIGQLGIEGGREGLFRRVHQQGVHRSRGSRRWRAAAANRTERITSRYLADSAKPQVSWQKSTAKR